MNNRMLKSVGAVLVGMLVAAALSTATDVLMRRAGIFPEQGYLMSNRLFGLAAAYRTIFGVIGAYFTARFAPANPMKHAMILGTLGLVVSVIGTVVTWNQAAEFGPHWYPISLIILALPPAWLGAKLYGWQLQARVERSS